MEHLIDTNKSANACFTEFDEEHDSQELRIVLLGVSGAGKSSTANAILGREAFKESRTRETGAQSNTLTCEKQDAEVSGRNISIIDTPGLLDQGWTRTQLNGFRRTLKKML
uniref:AIG1-type G domain-containing protein n=1 Tax=Cyprinus carpio TaxID=7962 RepID=A0A8C2DXZ0_CYPCA